MRNYIVHAIGEYDGSTDWLSSEQTPEEVMLEQVSDYGVYRMEILICEVDTLEVVDDEEDYTPGDVFEDYLRNGEDGETQFGITRISLWEMVPTLVRE